MMDLKGPILVITALGMVISGSVYARMQRQAAAAPDMIQTVSGKSAACSARGVDTAIGRLGCTASGGGGRGWSRRTSPGGALFISSGD